MEQTLDKIIERANILVEALPYINRYAGKIIIIKYGGNAMNDPAIMRTIMQDVAALKIVGVHPVIVHGGGPEINAMLKRLDIPSRFENGLRVTDAAAMEVVQMVLAGKINKNLTAMLNTMGVKAVGLCGKDGGLIRVEKMPARDGVDLGYVGRIVSIDTSVIEAVQQNFIPVIASVGTDAFGDGYNINADTAAGAIGRRARRRKAHVPDRHRRHPRRRKEAGNADKIHHRARNPRHDRRRAHQRRHDPQGQQLHLRHRKGRIQRAHY